MKMRAADAQIAAMQVPGTPCIGAHRPRQISRDQRKYPLSVPSCSQFLAQPLKLLDRSEEHTSELQSQSNLVCRLLLEKKRPSSALPDSRPTASLPCYA